MTSGTVPGTPSVLRGMNNRSVIALFLEHRMLSRSQISELSGLSKPTASQAIGRLESDGLIAHSGEVSHGRGPNAAAYSFNAGGDLGVAIDLNAHSIRSRVVDASDQERPIAARSLAMTSAARESVSTVRTAIDQACAAAGTPTEAVRSVCIGVQAAVNPLTDTITLTDTLPGWPRAGLREHLSSQLGLTVTIENDVNLAAVAERRFGIGLGVGDFAYLWMEAGLGVAVDIAGTVHRGFSGSAGELGYLPVPHSAARIAPESRDLQDLIGGSAVVRIARAHGVRGRRHSEVLAALTTSPSRAAVLADLAPRIALALEPILALLDPEIVVLGGPTGRVGGAELAGLVRTELVGSSRWSPRISATTVDDEPVLSGAAALLVDGLREALFARVDEL
ncbi:MAG: family transcriptional regulator [Aeromicrobium sp.]|nr:family transcriptional regulator [Aeromicrobium sp.]